MYNFSNYNVEQGLCQSQVKAICQDTKGMIWIGTNLGGVSVFDGQKFRNFGKKEGLNNLSISGILLFNGIIYVATTSELYKYVGDKFIKLTESKSTILSINSYNNKLLVCTEKGAMYFDKDKLIPICDDINLNNASIYCSYVDKENNLWLGSLSSGLFCMNNNSKRPTTINLKSQQGEQLAVFSINQTGQNKMVIATQFGVYYVKNENISLLPNFNQLDNTGFFNLLKLDDNTMLLSSAHSGVFFYNTAKSTIVKTIDSRKGYTKNSTFLTFLDRENNLWFGTDGSGIYKLSSEKFKYFNEQSGLQETYTNSLLKSKSGLLFVATRNNGINIIGKNYFETVGIKPNENNSFLSDQNVNTILELDTNTILFGTNLGLSKYSNGKVMPYSITNLNNKFIWNLTKISSSKILINTTSGSFILENNSVTELTKVNNLLGINNDQKFILCGLKDAKENLWIGTDIGIIKSNDKEITLFDSKNGFADVQTNCIEQDFDNNLWFGTDDGIFTFNGNKFIKFESDDYNFGYVNFIKKIQGKKLIVGNNNGMHIIDYELYKNNKPHLKHYSIEDGLLSPESNINAIHVDEKGIVYIGTVKGVEVYDPSQEKINTQEPITTITKVDLFYGNENVYKHSALDSLTNLPKNLELPYSKNNLTFSFIGVNHTAPEKTKYQYQLIGLDENWVPTNNQTSITYPAIPPGSYTFAIKACNNDGVWNKEPVIFVFTINPPWYKTWWFYSFSGFILIGAIILYNRARTKKLIKDRERLEQIVNIRTSELRAEKEKVEQINKEVTEQKQIIEHKQNEIIASINYAKRIQQALLPTKKAIEKGLKK